MIQITNKTKYPIGKLIELAKFARQLLPVNPLIYVGNTMMGWKGTAWRHKIEIYLSNRTHFPRQFSSAYCFKNVAIPDCVVDWDDAFVEVCAHEYFHSFQILTKNRISERDAEAYGIGRLLAYLKSKGVEPSMIKPSIQHIHTVRITNGIPLVKVRNKYIHNWGITE